MGGCLIPVGGACTRLGCWKINAPLALFVLNAAVAVAIPTINNTVV